MDKKILRGSIFGVILALILVSGFAFAQSDIKDGKSDFGRQSAALASPPVQADTSSKTLRIAFIAYQNPDKLAGDLKPVIACDTEIFGLNHHVTPKIRQIKDLNHAGLSQSSRIASLGIDDPDPGPGRDPFAVGWPAQAQRIIIELGAQFCHAVLVHDAHWR